MTIHEHLRLSHLLLSGLLLVGLCACQSEKEPLPPEAGVQSYDFPNILDLQGVPDSAFDKGPSAFSDLGSWFAYALPDEERKDAPGSFSGPYLFTQDNGVWINSFLSKLYIADGTTGRAFDLSKATIMETNSYPGSLRQTFDLKEAGLHISSELIFVTDRTARIQLVITATAEQDASFVFGWKGESFMAGTGFEATGKNVRIHFHGNENIGVISWPTQMNVLTEVADDQYRLESPLQSLSAGEQLTSYLFHSFCFSETEWQKEEAKLAAIADDPLAQTKMHHKRWDHWLNRIMEDIEEPFATEAFKGVAVKCLQTLTSNWRSPAGFLKHQGLFPSYHYEWFHGFWSWDSWKQAVSLARFDATLAQDQIRAMFDFQDDAGMIADCVYRDTIIENHNWRDTKPPLAAWAIWRTYELSGDKAFLEELFPKAVKYHRWWYDYRDHDQNGLCEYGSTDGTLVAAKWESGMDNAVRFDDTRLLENENGGWSMNRESVDLNAYLFADKQFLEKIAGALGLHSAERQFAEEGSRLKEKIQNTFFAEETGWFHDVDVETKAPITNYGAEGWIPLWAGAATVEQAETVKRTMLDTAKFATYIPFPTLAADEPGFDPNGSYWRGPVWLDQAYFAITALKNYGYVDEAEMFTKQLLDRLEGLKNSGLPIRENYSPLTGEGFESQHFSWSAAHLLLLLTAP